MGKPHQWGMLKYVSRKICRYCGLLWLNNERSEQAARKMCRWWED